MTSARTDIHRPSAPEFDPESYRYAGAYYFGSNEIAALMGAGTWTQFNEREIQLEAQGYVRGGSHLGGCGHCGANIMYAGLMVHEASHEWILVGETCLGGRFAGSRADFDNLRRSAKAARAAIKEREAFEALCAEHPELAYASYAHSIAVCGIGDYSANLPELPETFGNASRQGWALSTLDDIATKARRYGKISEKQIALVTKLLGQVEQAAVDLVARQAEQAEVPDLVTGRRELVGECVSIKFVDSDFGGAWKMLVVLDDGTKVYGTCPRSLEIEEGQRVAFTATVERSQRKPERTFGYFKRPTQAKVVG